MNGVEQAGPAGFGMVTAACIFVGGEPTFELVAYPALLRALPWFRGGRDVTVVRGLDRESRLLQIASPGPHRLHARMVNRLDKFPPVVLRVRRLEHLRPEARDPETVAHTIAFGRELRITLPEWARPPVPITPPVTSFGPALAGGVR